MVLVTRASLKTSKINLHLLEGSNCLFSNV
jgi:hypothetical protein